MSRNREVIFRSVVIFIITIHEDLTRRFYVTFLAAVAVAFIILLVISDQTNTTMDELLGTGLLWIIVLGVGMFFVVVGGC